MFILLVNDSDILGLSVDQLQYVSKKLTRQIWPFRRSIVGKIARTFEERSRYGAISSLS